MSFNVERGFAYGLDALSYYFIPHWAIEYAARKVAASNLEKAIENKCGDAGASNQTDLQKELSDTIKTKLFYMPKVPNRIPLLGGKPIPVPWPGDPVLLMSLGGMTDNWLFKGLLYLGAFAAISMSRGGLFLSNAPWMSGLGPIKNGKYSTALKNVTDKIQCNNEPPSGGSPVRNPSDATEAAPASDLTPGALPAANMVSSAFMAGIPITDLSSQLSKVYGTGSPSKAATAKPGAAKISGPSVSMPVIVPIIPQAPITLPAPRPVPVLRPILVAP